MCKKKQKLPSVGFRTETQRSYKTSWQNDSMIIIIINKNKKINKNYTTEQLEKNARNLNSNGINIV